MSRLATLLLTAALMLTALASPATAQDSGGEPSYVLYHSGDDTVLVGTNVVWVLAATGADGDGLSGLRVRFVRSGTAGSSESCFVAVLDQCAATDGNGQAFTGLDVGRQGTYEMRAEVYDAQGTLVAAVGPDVVFVQGACRGTRDLDPCASHPTLAGSSEPGNDVLQVNAVIWRGPTKVNLQRWHGNRWVRVGQVKDLNRHGRCSFRVRDLNGPATTTRYRAVLSANANYPREVTTSRSVR